MLSPIYEKAKQLLRGQIIPAGIYSYDLNGNHYKSVMRLEKMTEFELRQKMKKRLQLSGECTVEVTQPAKGKKGHIAVCTHNPEIVGF